jgi:hydroxyacylglutathione hydrolase
MLQYQRTETRLDYLERSWNKHTANLSLDGRYHTTRYIITLYDRKIEKIYKFRSTSLLMKTEKICEGVWKLKGSTCTYLLTIKNNQWVMIDAGHYNEYEELKTTIEEIVSLDKIDYVLLTHLHYDHVGCIKLFKNARIFAAMEEIEDYRHGAKEFHYFAGEKQDAILWDRLEELPKEILGLEILKVPGHTRGCVAFLDRKRKLLFSGDTIFAGEIIGRTDLQNSLPEQMNWSVETLRKLEREGFQVLAGHGK